MRYDKSYLIKDAFLHADKEQKVYLNEIPKFTVLKQVIEKKQPFYYLELPCEEEDPEKYICDKYLVEIKGNNFPINFGR